MPNTVKVPLLGNVPKGGLFAGGLAAVGVTGYLVYKHQKNQAIAATPSPAGSAYGYGAAYGYGSAYGYAMSAFGYGYGPAGYGFGQYGAGGFGGFGPVSPFGYAVAAPQTNAQWAQNATTNLTNQGYTGTAVLAALGAYLSGKPVQQGSSEDTTIQAAIAIEGDPPQPGTGGFPPAVNYQGSNPGQTQGEVTVPNVHGLDLSRADQILGSAGLKFNTSPAKSRKGYNRTVTDQNPKAGQKVKSGSYVSLSWKYEKQ